MLLGLGVAAALVQGPASAQVSITGNGPYYATPSWDQKLITGRFIGKRPAKAVLSWA